MSATALGRTWAFCCPMLPNEECSSDTWAQDVTGCTQNAPSNPEHGQKTGTEDKCSLLILHWLLPQEFPLTPFAEQLRITFFLFCHIIFCLMTGELGAVPIKHGESQCPLRGRVGDVGWLQIGSLERSGLFATICRKRSHPPTALIPNQVNAL